MKKIIIIIFISLFFIPNYKAKETVTFSKCIDGDTARVIYNNEEIKIRFLGIDTPELAHDDTEEERYAKEASNYTCETLKKSNKIEIEFDPKSDKQDKYDRYLVWIFIDDKLLQESLVKKGYAKVKYTYDDYLYLDSLYKAEEYAKEKKIGIWSQEENDIPSNKKEYYDFIPYIIPILLVLLIIFISKIIKR